MLHRSSQPSPALPSVGRNTSIAPRTRRDSYAELWVVSTCWSDRPLTSSAGGTSNNLIILRDRTGMDISHSLASHNSIPSTNTITNWLFVVGTVSGLQSRPRILRPGDLREMINRLSSIESRQSACSCSNRDLPPLPAPGTEPAVDEIPPSHAGSAPARESPNDTCAFRNSYWSWT
jgi:hypothetical protein